MTHKCIVKFYKHTGYFKNTREARKEPETQAQSSASQTSQMFLKICYAI